MAVFYSKFMNMGARAMDFHNKFGTAVFAVILLSLLLLPQLPLGLSTPAVGSTRSSPGSVASPGNVVLWGPFGHPEGLNVSQIRRAYGFASLGCYGAGTCGSGQVIAIVDAYNSPSVSTDLGNFSSYYHLPICTTANGCLTIATPQGTPQKTNTSILGEWIYEITLDTQWAHAIAPNAKILLVEARNQSSGALLAAVKYASSYPGVHQVSMSWAFWDNSTDSAFDQYFQVSGVSFFAASGDSGWNASGVVEWPAASPYVVGVGGTVLSLGSGGNVLSEVAWSGSGGGTNNYVTEPAYQHGFLPSWYTGGMRGVPDVSYVAGTALSIYISGWWYTVGGTSAGAPQWAALMAIVNGERSSPISGSFGADGALYAAANGTNYISNYRDIVSGSNANGHNCGNLCLAAPGYDFVTGLGSPMANCLVPFLVGQPVCHQYYLTMSAAYEGKGICEFGSISPSSGWYNGTNKVTISATIGSGCSFLGWAGSGSGSYTGSSLSHGITMNGPITETATFYCRSNCLE